jgi:transcription elongation factor Elf1
MERSRHGEARIRNPVLTVSVENTCPVCGYEGLAKAPYDKRGFGSLEACASCGFQFNVSDTGHGWSHRDWRDRWIADGMRWSSQTVRPPPRWSAKNQLNKRRGRLSPH